MDVVTFLALSVNLVGGGVLWYWYLYEMVRAHV